MAEDSEKPHNKNLPNLDQLPENWEIEDEEDKPRDQMTFLNHLEDLRWTILKSAIAFGIACVIVIVFLTQFADLLKWPYNFAVSGRTMGMSGLINTSILGVFSVIFYLMLGGGLALSLPFMLYFVGQFVAPGLTTAEMRLLRPSCLAAFFLFLIGCIFSFLILVPAALRASIIFSEMLGFAPLWTASSYYGLLTWMVLGVGLAFEFPLVLLILVYLKILTPNQIVEFRKYSVVIFLAVAAVVTPTTDPVTFLLLAGPMSVLYEIAIFFAKRISKE